MKRKTISAEEPKTITVRKIKPFLAKHLKTTAEKEGKSVNQLIIDTLEESLGIKKKKRFTKKYHDLDFLFGKWSDKEFMRIQGRITAQRNIDQDLWK